LRILFISLLITAVVVSCAIQKSIRADFENNFKIYNEQMRWHQFEDIILFPSDSIVGEFKKRAMAAKNVAVVDYRILSVKYEEEKKEAEAKIEIDYYSNSSPRVRTVVDNQKWSYQIKKGKGVWKLMSLLPEFP